MGFNPTTHVDDMVVLVTEPSEERFGELARLTDHDWKEYGVYFVEFADGTQAQFPDGMCKGDPKSPVRTFYRHRNEAGRRFDEKGVGPNSLQKTHQELGVGDLTTFVRKYQALFGVQPQSSAPPP
jgi:hypothetical protein